MIILSILTKTYAWVLGSRHPWLGIGLWVIGLGADIAWFARRGGSPHDFALRPARAAARVAAAHFSLLVTAWTVWHMMAYAAIRWKDGLDGIAWVAAWAFRAAGLPVAAGRGALCLSTMAGPLTFLASIDHLGLMVPALMLALAGVFLLLTRPSLASVGRAWGALALLLTAVTVVRFVLGVGLMLAVCDFVGYETEELPVSPFLRSEAIALMYLPLLLAVWPLTARLIRPRSTASEAVAEPSRQLSWLGTVGLGAAALLLWTLALWQPQGRLKHKGARR